jgi:hypothetical protein
VGIFLKQSSTAHPLLFLLIASTDHLTGKTGATPTVTLSKDGAAFASPLGAVTELANGWYAVAGNATDTNTAGQLLLHATATGADPTDEVYRVVAYDPDNATSLGLADLDATISSRLATAGYTAPPAAAAIATAVAAPSAATIAASVAAGSVASVVGAVGSVTDKTGYALSSGEHSLISGTDVPAGLVIGHLTVVRADKLDALDATISSRLASAAYVAPNNSDVASLLARTDPTTALTEIAADTDTLLLRADVLTSSRLAATSDPTSALTTAQTALNAIAALLVTLMDDVQLTATNIALTNAVNAIQTVQATVLAGITAINDQTQQLVFSIDGEVDANAVTGGGSSTDTNSAAILSAAQAIQAQTDRLHFSSGSVQAVITNLVPGSIQVVSRLPSMSIAPIDNLPPEVPIRIARGTNLSYIITVLNADGTPADLTGKTAELLVKASYATSDRGALITKNTTTLGGLTIVTGGSIAVGLTQEDTAEDEPYKRFPTDVPRVFSVKLWPDGIIVQHGSFTVADSGINSIVSP